MPPSIPLLFGPMLIGAFFNTMLYGVLAIQSLIYFQTYKRDSIWLKCFAFYLLVAETVNTGLIIGLLYEPLILKYGQPAATTFFPVHPIMTIAVSTPVQLFIAWRIIIISGKRYFAFIIWVFALISTGGAIWLAHTVVDVKRFARKPDLHWPALTWLLASMIADVIITFSLVHSLAKRRTGIVQTDDIINKIIRMTIQTGLVTAIFAILDVICFLVIPARYLELNPFQLSLTGRSKSLDMSSSRTGSRRTADDIEVGVSSVKEHLITVDKRADRQTGDYLPGKP
ncbi:hypothetical protein AGABI2DRAFT_179048 [Agaricus bisporus var. bisporus H97]|uniref:hypothetical protein n=1 Tax=Agaricus bisporus var. bisporus (strain H97 / ATCC MYA-4626 / FGSC 10389) TaxID=936046 RepID=UPI00029F7102|nr:hypothetical protein AGABI2DRAFT_179048 [Agaricus bisporus var. bisporus H97]EKV46864.1 hypothetical protein AGABI2DRAFT_179048 [Agaricus bisporus var. bisporus H97]